MNGICFLPGRRTLSLVARVDMSRVRWYTLFAIFRKELMSGKHVFLYAALAFCLPLSAMASEPGSFCTMDQAVGQMISAAGINTGAIYKDMGGARSLQGINSVVRDFAAGLVKEKLRSGHGDKLEITWKDIYDLRGTMSAWVCDNGCRFYCVASFIDAIGSGMTGTTIGRGLTNAGLVLAGPPGFVMMGGMSVTQKSFQCNPSVVAMALESGETVVGMLPWCKAPGAKALCARAGDLAGKTVVRVMARYGGQEYAIGVARALSPRSNEFVEVTIEYLAHKAKEGVLKPVTHKVESRIMSGLGKSDPVQDASPPAGVPIGDGLYYNDPSQYMQ